MAEARIGISGWRYRPWRGVFYPKGLRQADELAYAAARMNSLELNGSFYSLQRPASWERWRDGVPDDFVFAVKGARFITHVKRLRDVDAPLANFFASGVLDLGRKLGPLLWQLPPTLGYDPGLLEAFLGRLPRTRAEAARLAARHDERLEGRSSFRVDEDAPLRHAVEVRHPSFGRAIEDWTALLARYDVASVVADTAGRYPGSTTSPPGSSTRACTARPSSTPRATTTPRSTAGRRGRGGTSPTDATPTSISTTTRRCGRPSTRWRWRHASAAERPGGPNSPWKDGSGQPRHAGGGCPAAARLPA